MIATLHLWVRGRGRDEREGYEVVCWKKYSPCVWCRGEMLDRHGEDYIGGGDRGGGSLGGNRIGVIRVRCNYDVYRA